VAKRCALHRELPAGRGTEHDDAGLGTGEVGGDPVEVGAVAGACAGDDIAGVAGVEKDHGLALIRQAAKAAAQVGVAHAGKAYRDFVNGFDIVRRDLSDGLRRCIGSALGRNRPNG
jgi:hypothetical protein